MQEQRNCPHCGAQWLVSIERIIGDSVPSSDGLGMRRQTWLRERVVEGTPCDCARRAEAESAQRAKEAAAQRQRDAAAMYVTVTSHGAPLQQDTPLRLPDYDYGGWSDPRPIGKLAYRFWVMGGKLYYVNEGERTATQLERGAMYIDGELRVSDLWLLM